MLDGETISVFSFFVFQKCGGRPQISPTGEEDNVMPGENLIIFTDLDGTLLGLNTYSYQEAKEALRLVKSERIPVIFCSAKTMAEQEVYRDELKINDPFIVENGGAIFIEKDYFPFSYEYQRSFATYNVIEIGMPYEEIRRILEQVRAQTHVVVKGYGDMSVEEVGLETGLDLQAAKRAMQRQYGETIKLERRTRS
jgi:mannosyl-3-phosphoglycerate synthase